MLNLIPLVGVFGLFGSGFQIGTLFWGYFLLNKWRWAVLGFGVGQIANAFLIALGSRVEPTSANAPVSATEYWILALFVAWTVFILATAIHAWRLARRR